MSASRLDAVYRSILITKFFTKGWGKPENLRRLFEFRKIVSNRDECYKLVDKDYPVTITKEETSSDCKIIEGHFLSPLDRCLPGIVPEAAKNAYFQAILPLKWKEEAYKPMCLHLAGTGDHYFWRRRNLMAKPLLKEAGIGAIILENPFYGLRKPIDQVRSSLHNVSDIFVMGGCLILESLVLFHWCERNGLGPLGVTGLSMGGHMASLAATNWPRPLVLVPCLSWSTASAVFTQGVMANSINWNMLESQYLSDGVYREKLSKMVTIVDEAFLAGKKFARKFSQSMEEARPGGSNGQRIGNADIRVDPTSEENELNLELLRLMETKKIQPELFNKLTSNEKFEVTPAEVEQLNKLNEASILKKLSMKYNMGLAPKSEAPSTPEIAKKGSRNISEITMDILSSLPFIRNKSTTTGLEMKDREALQFMRGVMDECTHLSNFSVPYDTSLIIAVCAKHDAYVPREDVGNLAEIWPGAEIRYVDAGHVSAYILHQNLFRSSIIEAFERSKSMWKDGQHLK